MDFLRHSRLSQLAKEEDKDNTKSRKKDKRKGQDQEDVSAYFKQSGAPADITSDNTGVARHKLPKPVENIDTFCRESSGSARPQYEESRSHESLAIPRTGPEHIASTASSLSQVSKTTFTRSGRQLTLDKEAAPRSVAHSESSLRSPTPESVRRALEETGVLNATSIDATGHRTRLPIIASSPIPKSSECMLISSTYQTDVNEKRDETILPTEMHLANTTGGVVQSNPQLDEQPPAQPDRQSPAANNDSNEKPKSPQGACSMCPECCARRGQDRSAPETDRGHVSSNCGEHVPHHRKEHQRARVSSVVTTPDPIRGMDVSTSREQIGHNLRIKRPKTVPQTTEDPHTTEVLNQSGSSNPAAHPPTVPLDPSFGPANQTIYPYPSVPGIIPSVSREAGIAHTNLEVTPRRQFYATPIQLTQDRQKIASENSGEQRRPVTGFRDGDESVAVSPGMSSEYVLPLDNPLPDEEFLTISQFNASSRADMTCARIPFQDYPEPYPLLEAEHKPSYAYEMQSPLGFNPLPPKDGHDFSNEPVRRAFHDPEFEETLLMEESANEFPPDIAVEMATYLIDHDMPFDIDFETIGIDEGDFPEAEIFRDFQQEAFDWSLGTHEDFDLWNIRMQEEAVQRVVDTQEDQPVYQEDRVAQPRHLERHYGPAETQQNHPVYHEQWGPRSINQERHYNPNDDQERALQSFWRPRRY